MLYIEIILFQNKGAADWVTVSKISSHVEGSKFSRKIHELEMITNNPDVVYSFFKENVYYKPNISTHIQTTSTSTNTYEQASYGWM